MSKYCRRETHEPISDTLSEAGQGQEQSDCSDTASPDGKSKSSSPFPSPPPCGGAGSEPQSIVEFYCDDDISIQSQWGFMASASEEPDSFFTTNKPQLYQEDLFLSMSFLNDNI